MSSSVLIRSCKPAAVLAGVLFVVNGMFTVTKPATPFLNATSCAAVLLMVVAQLDYMPCTKGASGLSATDIVSREADVAALMDGAVETYGRIDCAFNNAGRELKVGITNGTEADFDGIVATNTKGVFFCLKHEFRHMRSAGGGAIVNNTSAAGLVPTDVNHLYGMSKRAVTHLTQTAARQGGKLGIRVNEVAPALLMTEMVKGYFEGPDAVPLENVIARLALNHVGQPEDATGAVLFLCSEQASFITGVTLPVDGGFVLYNAGSYQQRPLPMAVTRSVEIRCSPLSGVYEMEQAPWLLRERRR